MPVLRRDDEEHVQPPPLTLQIASPLASTPSPAHLEQIAQARRLGARVRRAQLIAAISGWTTLVFGVLTLLTSFGSLPALMLGIGMSIVSIIEFRGSADIKRLERSAPRRLAVNQLALGALLFSYAALSLMRALDRPGELLNDPQLQQMLGPIREIEKLVYVSVYAAMLVVAIVGPGLTAWYYASRVKHIDAYLRQAPKWIIELQQAGMSL